MHKKTNDLYNHKEALLIDETEFVPVYMETEFVPVYIIVNWF